MAQPRQWTVHPDETGEVNREHLTRVMLEAAVIVAAMGGSVAVTSRREEDTEVAGELYTTHVVVRWYSKGSHTVRHPEATESPAAEQEQEADALEVAAEPVEFVEDPEPIVSEHDGERRLPDPDSDEIPEDIPSGAEILAAADR